jgi:hypothetical protein
MSATADLLPEVQLRSSSSAELEQRILDAFPSGTYALLGMLRLLEVTASREIDTAAVECKIQPRLLINPDFVETWANTPEKLLMLVLHELHHVLLGHTTQFPRATPVQNIVFDAVINALLCRMFPESEHTSLFTDFYSEADFPDCLLRPPDDWHPQRPAPIPSALTEERFARVQPVYRALYSETGADYRELFEALAESTEPDQIKGVQLIGSHGPETETLKQRALVLFNAVREIVQRWPQPPDPVQGRSYSDLLRQDVVRPERNISDRERLRNLIRCVAGDGRGRGKGATNVIPRAMITPVPCLDRRSLVLRGLGQTPLLYTADIPHQSPAPQERVHLYLDVSGSIGDLKNCLYGAVLDCAEFVHPAVHLFSTQVHDVTLVELRRGTCRSTDGTDIICVGKHMRQKRIRRAVILTDGYVGRPTCKIAKWLSGALLGVALTPGDTTRTDLEQVTDFWTELKGRRK